MGSRGAYEGIGAEEEDKTEVVWGIGSLGTISDL
jgi:hypothetical protein